MGKERGLGVSRGDLVTAISTFIAVAAITYILVVWKAQADFWAWAYLQLGFAALTALSLFSRVRTSAVRHASWAGPITAAITFPLWLHFAPPQGAGNDFYSTVAQVLPVFFLAVVVDLNNPGSVNRNATLVTMSLICMSEMAALYQLAADTEDKWTYASVSSALGGAIGGFVVAVIVKIDSDTTGVRGGAPRRSADRRP